MTSSRFRALLLVGAASSLIACSDSGGNAGPCESDAPPAECSVECENDAGCPGGYFCGSDGSCTADCVIDSDCDDGNACGDDGRCDDGGGDGDGDGDSGDGDGDGDGDDCPAVSVDLTPLVPVVVLLIDQSGSMDEPFGNSDRWESLKDALIGPNDDETGVLFQLEGSLDMGATLYTSTGGNDGGTCPQLEEVSPSVNNAGGIADLLRDNQPVIDTPTAESVVATTAAFPASDNPRVIVLATDGNPDNCVDPDAHDAGSQAGSEAAVADAYGEGISTFVLSVGDDTAEDHLQRLANAGQGLPANGNAEFYVALNPEQLVEAFSEIVGGIRTCEIAIDGQVDLEDAGEGTVVLNGDELEYGTEWMLLDESTLVLIGAGCDAYLASDTVSLEAEWPCGGVVVD